MAFILISFVGGFQEAWAEIDSDYLNKLTAWSDSLTRLNLKDELVEYSNNFYSLCNTFDE